MAFFWTLFIGTLVANSALSEANMARNLFEKAKIPEQDAPGDFFENKEQAEFENDFVEHEDDNVKRVVNTPALPDCPCGWDRLGSACYLFSTEKRSYQDARSDCLKKGGDLALPLNAQENTLISDRAAELGIRYPWIGLFRQYENEFITVCGLKPSYTNWKPGLPDDYQNNEDCAHVYVTESGQPRGEWNDWVCSNLNEFVCELKFPRCE